MGNRKVTDNPYWTIFDEGMKPLESKLVEVKRRNEVRLREAAEEIKAQRFANVKAALENGISRNAICKRLGITSGVRQVEFMQKVLGGDWLDINASSGENQFLKPYRVGDWWVQRDFIDESNYVNDSDRGWFTVGNLWRDDAPDMVYGFSMRDGVKYAVEMFHPDGLEVDMTAHFGYHLVWPRTATDDGTVYGVGGKGKWFAEDVEDDVFEWLTNGYTQRKAGWPSRPKG